jgi:hypothetical protein
MTGRYYFAVGLLLLFFASVFFVAVLSNPHYPVLVFTGESSVGTWMSGVLLMFAAATSLNLSIQKSLYPWLILSAFFLVLTLDEHFMFHEAMKDKLIVTLHNSKWKYWWVYELPVIVGALIGVYVTSVLWRYFKGRGRILLAAATLLGAISVVIDVTASGVFLEEIAKLLAELLIVCMLIGKMGE